MVEDDPDLVDLMLDEEIDFPLVMQCVFGIQAHETRTYFALLGAPGSTVMELADRLDRDRSNVNRSLSTLHERGLITRERRLLDGGGYVYQYLAVPLDTTKQRMHEGVDRWVDAVHEHIDSFGSG